VRVLQRADFSDLCCIVSHRGFTAARSGGSAKISHATFFSDFGCLRPPDFVRRWDAPIRYRRFACRCHISTAATRFEGSNLWSALVSREMRAVLGA
jgi:hypothetical protein